MNHDLRFRTVQPDPSLRHFVDSFWMLSNESGSDRAVVILPDGRIDLILSKSSIRNFQATLLGLGTQPEPAVLAADTVMFAVSFKLLAAEFLFQSPVSHLLNHAENVRENFWNFSEADLQDFDRFCQNVSQTIHARLPSAIDPRKQKLFDLIYATNGDVSIQELSEQVFWSSRQINRYFNQQFGLSLKSYAGILRFRASFQHIKEGKLFPQQNFTDQSHFIKEVRKLAGVLPKELRKNQNDRFIQFSTLPLP